MTLNNTYTIYRKPLKELLDNVDGFITNINKFRTKHKGYNYTIQLNKNGELWDAEIKINYEKQKSTKTITRVIEPPTLL